MSSLSLSLSLSVSSSSSSLQTKFQNLRSDPKKIFVLDGGTGEELFRRGVPDDRKHWSATALVHEKFHSTLQQVHESFLQAGSDAITSNSYGVVPGVGFTPDECTKYINVAGKIARDAIANNHPPTGCVFGSLGPLVESYRADMIKEHDEGVQHYELACRALYPYVDAFLAETMSCVKESFQALDAVAGLTPTKPLLISYTLDSNGNFRDGQSVLEGLNELLDYKSEKNQIDLLAIMFNCAEPEAITTALSRVQSDQKLKQRLHERQILLGAYANRLTAVDPGWTLAESETAQPFRKDLDVEHYWSGFVKLWIEELGVQLVGGCCGITPEHISCIRTEVDKRQK